MSEEQPARETYGASYERALEEESARRYALIRQRIRGIRAANRTLPISQIAFHVGVSIHYAANALGEPAYHDP